MKLQRFILLAAVFGAVTACDRDTGGSLTDPGALAYVRYVHAIPDTGAVTVRVTDRVENLNCAEVTYRTVCPYAGIAPGTRKFKVFSGVNNELSTVTQVIHEQDVTLTAGTYYTIVHSGFARTGGNPADNFSVIEDNTTTPAGNKFSLRAIVAAPGFTANQDVYVTATTTSALPATPTFSGVARLTPTTWAVLDTGTAAVRSFDTGTTATARVTSTVLAGFTPPTSEPGSVATLGAGSRTGGALTAFIFPAGPAGTGNAAGVTYAVDRRPQ